LSEKLFAGEQFDEVLDQYFLRARYYNQASGRFTQQDTWMGRNIDPITLNKYLYANSDPVFYTDPTGNSPFAGLGVSMSAAAQLGARTIGSSAVGKFLGRTFVAAATATIVSIKTEVNRCIKTKGKKCRIPNMVVIGSGHPESQEHIANAQVGKGSNGILISPVVTYKQGANKSRSWLNNTDECRVKNGKDCDEYPFAATVEGGRKRYRSGMVSLRLMTPSDNQGSGRLWGRATRKMNGKKFVIVPKGPISFYMKDGVPGF
jgi:RHS repeat-associated protein